MASDASQGRTVRNGTERGVTMGLFFGCRGDWTNGEWPCQCSWCQGERLTSPPTSPRSDDHEAVPQRPISEKEKRRMRKIMRLIKKAMMR